MAEKTGEFSHPAFKKLSMINGEINKMSCEELRSKLKAHHLNPRGAKEVMRKRLKAYYHKNKLQSAGIPVKKSSKECNYFLVVDFEATCELDERDYPHEIIEFPIIVIDSSTQEIVDEFHSFVRPVVNPTLTQFCTELTGITQSQVDRSPVFTDVLRNAESWLQDNKYLGEGINTVVVTDGPWDMSRFMLLQCGHSCIPFPEWGSRWVNIRKTYCNFYRFSRANLSKMLDNLGMTFEGRPHSGLDDTRNIARIAQRMLQDGSPLKINESLHIDQKEKAKSSGVPKKTKCKSDKDIRDKERSEKPSDSVSDITSNLASLSVASDCESLCDESDHEDLLSYYALQKS